MSHAVTLSSLAMLKVSIDSGGDYLEYLRPYVIQVLIESQPDIVTDSTVAKHLREICGLEIPHRTINIVLQRLASQGYLKKANGIFSIAKDLPAVDNSAERAIASRRIGTVTSALVSFAKLGPKPDLTEDEATDCFIVFLSHFSIPCLRSYLRGNALPNITGHSDWHVTLVSQFVNELPLRPELFESFMTLVQGHMLANALLCPDLQSVSKTYKDVVFYFDTPLLIQFLGLEGEQEKQAMEEVVRLVQRLHGRISYFSHTSDELFGAIRGSADFIDSVRGRGTIVEEARKSGRTKSDLLLIAQNATETLAESNIIITATPPYDEKTYKFEIAEEIFSDVLEDEVNYHNPRAKDYDIKSVRSIYVLRKGIVPSSIEKSQAVFVTSNSGFSKAAYEYGKKYEQSREVSTVITDFSLANTAWLKAPQGAPSLPRKEVLAFAYAALRPTNEFWSKVLDEAEKLESNGKISSRDHQLLRSSHHVQRELMKLTLGVNAALTEESITKTLSRVSSEIRQEESAKFREAERLRLETENKLNGQIAETDGIKAAIYWRCDRRAKREALTLSILIWIAQISVAIFGIFKIPDGSSLGWIMVLVAAASGVIRIASAIWDLKPAKAYSIFLDWRRGELVKKEHAALSIKP